MIGLIRQWMELFIKNIINILGVIKLIILFVQYNSLSFQLSALSTITNEDIDG